MWGGEASPPRFEKWGGDESNFPPGSLRWGGKDIPPPPPTMRGMNFQILRHPPHKLTFHGGKVQKLPPHMGGKSNDVKTSPSYGREVAKFSFPLILWEGRTKNFPPCGRDYFSNFPPTVSPDGRETSPQGSQNGGGEVGLIPPPPPM